MQLYKDPENVSFQTVNINANSSDRRLRGKNGGTPPLKTRWTPAITAIDVIPKSKITNLTRKHVICEVFSK